MKRQYINLAIDILEALGDVHLQLEVLKKQEGPEWPHIKDTRGRYVATDLLAAKANLMHSLALLSTAR